MSDLARTIIKWMLLIILAVLVILLVVGIVKRTSNKKNRPVQTMEKIKISNPEEDSKEDKTDSENTTDKDTNTSSESNQEKEETLMINLGNTASTRGASLWIGIAILGLTTCYIYVNRQTNE